MQQVLHGDGRLLDIRQMGAADRGAIDSGIAGIELMEHAGAGVARAIRKRFAPGPVTILCGPGNNGGDGFVAARHLRRDGWPVRLGLMGDPAKLRGDAKRAADAWRGPIEAAAPELLNGAGLLVDALFGAGLDRPIEGAARTLIEAMAASGAPLVEVDVPSGLHGDTGDVLGVAARAALTVTFHRPKPGHLLLPGRELAGELVVVDIGIPDRVTESLEVRLAVNGPRRWRHLLPRRSGASHKYRHGHALVVGGPAVRTGAARMAAEAALRTGAGLVTVLASEPALPVYAAHLTAVMVAAVGDEAAFAEAIADPRRNAVLLGPGGGVGQDLKQRVCRVLDGGKATVLDADALTSFADAPSELFDRVQGPTVFTPHEGEFARLFDPGGDKVTRARRAAAASGAVVLLKGGDTVVAAPDGRAILQPWAPPALATAGSGDVLAGIVLGLLAQGMPAFEAAAAAVWLHALAGEEAPAPGLIAEDLIGALPRALARV